MPASAENLAQAWATALAADRGLVAAREATAEATSTLEAARAAALPRVGVEAGYGVLGQEPTMRADFLNQRVELPVSQTRSANYKAGVSVPVFAGGRIVRGIDAAAAAREAAEAGEAGSRQDLKLRVAEAFVAVLRAERGAELAESHVTRLESHAQDVRNLLSHGLVSRSDLLAVEVASSEARQRVLLANHGLDLARSSYNRLLGRPLAHLVSLDVPQDIAEVPISGTPSELRLLTERAHAQRSELAQFASRLDALRSQVASVRAEASPQVALNAGYQYQQNRYQVHPGQWFAGVGVNWAVFDGGVVNHRADAVERQVAAATAQRDEFASLLDLQVRQNWLAVQEATGRAKLGSATVAQAEENLRVVQDRYANGLTTHTEVLGAEALRLGSLVQAADVRFDVLVSRLRLRRAIGDL